MKSTRILLFTRTHSSMDLMCYSQFSVKQLVIHYCLYSLSDPSLGTTFSTVFVTKRSSLSSKICQQNKHTILCYWQWSNYTIRPYKQKSTFCEVETKSMFIHIHTSAPIRFAKFGWQTQTFCHRKAGKAVNKLESDRLYVL